MLSFVYQPHMQRLFAVVVWGVIVLAGEPNMVHSRELTLDKGISRFSIDTSTADYCRPTIREQYTRYSLIPGNQIDGKPFLIRQDFDVGEGCNEGHFPARVTVVGQQLNIQRDKVTQIEAWRFSTSGISGRMDDGLFYVVEGSGCCGAAQSTKYFSLRNGTQLGASTGGQILKFRVSGDASDSFQQIAVENNDPSDPMGPRFAVATFFHFDRTRLRRAVSIFSDVECHLLKVGFLDRDTEGNKALALSKLSEEVLAIDLVCLDNQPPPRVLIPFSAETLEIEKGNVKKYPVIRVEDVTSPRRAH